MTASAPVKPTSQEHDREALESVVVRFAGDSGDGIQLTGGQFTLATALAGNDLATFPDFPAEIRAPVGTTYGVSAFQINFGARRILTSGDAPDVLVTLNPAALKVNIVEMSAGGVVIVDPGSFDDRSLRKAGYESNPLTDGSLDAFRVIEIEIAKLTLDSVSDLDVTKKEAERCKNMFALGLIYWMYGRKRQTTVEWLNQKFAKRPEIAAANVAALNAGHAYGETMEISGEITGYTVSQAVIKPGVYRNITGNDAMALGLIAGANLAGLKMFLGSYPITPASAILHVLSRYKEYGVTTFQAEDEIAAICSAIGGSYAGQLGVTTSSGPGIALKTEALGLAIGVELPLVVVNVQRAGPSTGMPTKTEQSDLFQAVWGRNADAPLVVLAPQSPQDCFTLAIDACRIATRYMTPVMVLSDGYIANASEPWLLPDMNEFESFPAKFHTDPEGFHPFLRNPETLARAWAVPGTPGVEHRIGGIERDYNSGHISYDPANHEKMSQIRRDKVLGVAREFPDQGCEQGAAGGKLAVVGWGSTYGPISRAVQVCREEGLDVSHIHLRHIWPLPTNLGELLGSFDRVLVPEMNMGQLVTLLRSQYQRTFESLPKVTGKPFKIAEIDAAIRERVEK